MDFLKGYKKVIVWCLILVCILLMGVTATYKYTPSFFNRFVSPVITFPQKIISSVYDWYENRKDYEELITQIDELQKNNDNLKLENNRLEQLRKENNRLTTLLNFSETFPNYDKVTANVIAKDPTKWYNTFIIDVGTKDGILPNMVVVTSGGLVGKVIESAYGYSKVIAIVDDFTAVSGIVTRNDALGFVKGDLELLADGMIRMEYFDIDAEIMEGDEIVTSHLSQIYPKGIPIGYVKEIYTDSKGLSKYAKVVPYVNFENIKEVIVFREDFTKDTGSINNIE